MRELLELRERMRCVVGTSDDDIDLVTQAVGEIDKLRNRLMDIAAEENGNLK
jgi:hypothetical protein